MQLSVLYHFSHRDALISSRAEVSLFTQPCINKQYAQEGDIFNAIETGRFAWRTSEFRLTDRDFFGHYKRLKAASFAARSASPGNGYLTGASDQMPFTSTGRSGPRKRETGSVVRIHSQKFANRALSFQEGIPQPRQGRNWAMFFRPRRGLTSSTNG